jgi:hypothetical protein
VCVCVCACVRACVRACVCLSVPECVRIHIQAYGRIGLRFGRPPKLDLRLFNSSTCQKHQCTLASPAAPFFPSLSPHIDRFAHSLYLSLSLFFFIRLRFASPFSFCIRITTGGSLARMYWSYSRPEKVNATKGSK